MAARELEPTPTRGAATRSRGKLLALAAATVLVLYLCFLLITPFIPPIVWAVTAAVVTLMFFLLDVWRRRIEHGASAERA